MICTISTVINNLQTAMQATITTLLNSSENHEQSMTVDDQPAHVPSLCHSEISQAVSSVLNEDKEKSKRKLDIILHNIPESDAENVAI